MMGLLIFWKADSVTFMLVATSRPVAVLIVCAEKHAPVDATIHQAALASITVKIPLTDFANPGIAFVDADSVIHITIHIIRAICVGFTTVRNDLVELATHTTFRQADVTLDLAIRILFTCGAIFFGTTSRTLIAPGTDPAILIDLAWVIKADMHTTGSIAQLVYWTVNVVGTGLPNIGSTSTSDLITNLTGKAGPNLRADPRSRRSTARLNAFEATRALMIPLARIVVRVGYT